jgi:hypothetical protein
VCEADSDVESSPGKLPESDLDRLKFDFDAREESIGTGADNSQSPADSFRRYLIWLFSSEIRWKGILNK